MTAENSTNITKGKAPSHHAYLIREREGKPGYWTRIGSAWQHSDGNGFNIQLDATPNDGRVTLRLASESKE